MRQKENRPGAGDAYGTVPYNCINDITDICESQSIAYDDLLEAVTLAYLSDIDTDLSPDFSTVKVELLEITNDCIEKYNLGRPDENVPTTAKKSERYPDAKKPEARYRRLTALHPLQIAILIRELHHGVGILWNKAENEGNFDIGIYQTDGDNEGCYDTRDETLERLELAGVKLSETVKTDKKTGEKSVGWSYRMRDEWGPKRRTRKRRASNLADDLTKEGVERFFEEKQEQQTREELKAAPAPNQDSHMAGMEDTQQDSPAQHDFDMYEPSESDVRGMASDLKNAYAHSRKSEGMPIAGEQYEALANAENDPEDALAQLRADVERARREFRDSKEARDALKGACPSLAMGFGLYTLASRTGTDPVSRMMSDMMARMFRMMMLQFMEDQRRRMQEDAERRLYESRGNMWDAEKRLKAAEEALDNEAARHIKHRGVTPKMQQTAEATERVRDEDKHLGE